MKHLIAASLVLLACGCTARVNDPAVSPEPVTAAAPTQAVAGSTSNAPFKNDLPPSAVVRKSSDLWEYVGAGFYVPLATLLDSGRAWELARLAQGPKSPSHVQQLVISGTPYYRALLGPFKTKKAAEKEGKEFMKRKLVDTPLTVEYLKG